MGWPPLTGFNDDILDKTFSPHSQYLMADSIELIKITDIHGGKITLKIVRKGQAVRLPYSWISEVTSY